MMHVFTRVIWPTGALEISCPDVGAKCQYYCCNKREAMRRFRVANGLKYRHLIIIDI